MIDLLSVEPILDSTIKLCVAVGGVGILSQLKLMAKKKNKFKVFRKERILEVIEIARILTISAIGAIALAMVLANYISII